MEERSPTPDAPDLFELWSNYYAHIAPWLAKKLKEDAALRKEVDNE